MPADATPDVRPEAETVVQAAQPVQLSIHVVFQDLPIVAYTDESSGEGTVKHGPPFIRLPMNLTAEDARVLENIFGSARIALVGFEIQKSDGSPRFYRAVLSGE